MGRNRERLPFLCSFVHSFVYSSTLMQRLGGPRTGMRHRTQTRPSPLQLCPAIQELNGRRGRQEGARRVPKSEPAQRRLRRCLDSRPGLARPPAVECVSAMCHRPRLWENAAPLTSQQLPRARRPAEPGNGSRLPRGPRGTSERACRTPRSACLRSSPVGLSPCPLDPERFDFFPFS